jgi:hypothetical protein
MIEASLRKSEAYIRRAIFEASGIGEGQCDLFIAGSLYILGYKM